MKIQLEHIFAAPLELVAAATFHPDWPAFMVEHSGAFAAQQLLWQDDDGRSLTRRVQHLPRPSFDRLGPLHFPAEIFEFVEHSVWDRQWQTLRFENVPRLADAASRVSNRGEIVFRPAPEGTRRTICTEIRILSLPLLMRPFCSLIEHALVREAKRMLEAEARTLALWLTGDRRVPRAVPHPHVAELRAPRDGGHRFHGIVITGSSSS